MRTIGGLACVALMLSGCEAVRTQISGPPEVRTCEAFVQGKLRAPTSYSRIAVESSDRPDGGHVGSLSTGIRSVQLTYEAQNPMGVRLRDQEVCTFAVLDGRYRDPQPDLTARVALDRRDLWLRRPADQRVGSEPGCCTL